jgi:hypothetical protein
MGTEQTKQLIELNKLNEKVSILTFDYWQSYSNLNTWQFWFLFAMLVLPLIALYFFIDRKKIFLIGFFGFNIHVWFHYSDAFGVTHALWNYPYNVFPILVGFPLDAALIPVLFMFVYQWTLNKNKNYYLYATGLSAFLAFLFKPAMVTFGLFKLYKGMNYFYVFLIYIFVMLLAKWITNLFVYLSKGNKRLHLKRGIIRE